MVLPSLNPDEQIELRREKCKRSLFYFMTQFWDVLIPDKPIWNWHIPYVCSELERMYHRVAKTLPKEYDLILNQPPGTTKTLTATIFFPTWCWLNAPWMRFIVGSYSGQLSWATSDKVRDLIRSDKFKLWFPDIRIRSRRDAKSDFQIEYYKKGKWVNGGSRLSTSVGGTVTGYHAHIIIIDDPLNPKQAVSPTEINVANNWFDQTLPTRKVEKAVTPTILNMQRLVQDDPAGHLLNKKKLKIKHICLPGEAKHYGKCVKPKELLKFYKDDLLDPKRLSWDVLEELEERLGQYGYAGQIGQSPVPMTGAMFDPDLFTVLDQMPAGKIEWVRYWDKSSGGTYSVGVKMGKLKKPNGKPLFIISDVKRGQWATSKREDIIKTTAELDGTGVKTFVETEPGSGGKESTENTIDNLAGFSVYGDRPTGSKIVRADPYSVQVNRGNVILLRADWNEAFKEEHRFFPNGTYKDQVDAAAGAFSKLTRYKRAGTWGTPKTKTK